MRGSADADFETWLRDSFHNRPAPRHDVARELYEEQLAHRAADRERDWRHQELLALRKRVAQLEHIYGKGGSLGQPLVATLVAVAVKIRTDAKASVAESRDETLAEVDGSVALIYLNNNI